MAYFFRTKNLDLETGSASVAVLNEKQAESMGINSGDKVTLIWSKHKKVTANVDLSSKLVKPGQIGLFEEIWQKKKIEDDDITELIVESRPLSIKTLTKENVRETCFI